MAKIRKKATKGKIKVNEAGIDKALAAANAERKKKTLRLSILFIVMVLTFVVMKYWESSAEQEIRELAGDMKPTIRVDDTSANIETEDNDGISDVVDKGVGCRDHDYILSPGMSVTLKFEIKLEREVIQMAHLLKNNLANADVTVEGSFDKWEEKGLNAGIQSFDFESLTGKTNVWIVQAKELLVELKKSDQPAVDLAKGIYGRISGYVAKKTRYAVNFFDEENGVISTLGRYYYSEAKVGDLVAKDITGKLGGALTLAYVHKGKTYQLPVSGKEVDKNSYFIDLIVNIIIPDLPKDGAAAFGNIDSNFVVKVKEAVEMKFVLKLSYDAEKNEFHISGPAHDPGCYK